MDLFLSLLQGVPATLGMTAAGCVVGAVLGIPLVLMRRSSHAELRWPARVYLDVVRGIPPVVWLFIIYFGLGSGIWRLSAAQAGVIGLGLISSAYLAEIYRGGFTALPSGQQEASRALGMSRSDTLRFILAPQVLRVSIPPMATFFVGLLKDSSVVYTIGVRDIMMYTNQAAQQSHSAFMPFIVAAILYILLSIPVAWFSRYMDEVLRRRINR